MFTIIQIVMFLLNVVFYVIIAQGILSWLVAFNIVNRSNEFVRQVELLLNTLTEPLYRPLRKFIPPVGMVDLTPMAAIIIIIILQIILKNIAFSLII